MLKVWLPLNNSIQNKGLNASPVVVNGATSYADGKLGRCLSCDGSSYWTISPLTLGAVASIAFWAKTTDTNAMFYVLGATSNAHLNFWRANNKYYLNRGDSYNNPFQKNGSDVAWHNDGNWHHYVTVFNGTSCLLYVDGAYYGTAKTYAAPTCNGTNVRIAGGFNNTHLYDTSGLMSDFRVYDTVISEQDIKELYWGKIYELTPQWKHSGELSVLGDASGVGPLTRQTIGDVSLSGNTLYFNGTTGSTIKFDGFGAVGGALSIWYRYESTISGNQVLFLDPVNKMTLGYNGSGAFIVSTVSQARYSATGATANKWNHVVVNYGTDGKATGCWVNGVTPATASTEYWSTAGTIACIGARAKSATIDAPFKGYINEIKVFQSQLTANDVQYLYKRGLMDNNWTPVEQPVWLRILHHNAPATNLFTQANSRDNDDENLFSKLKVLFNNDNFRRADGNYEFMAKEKLNSTSTEQTYRWTQTSNPTASTCTGYKLVSQTNNPGRNFGISFGPTGNCVFSNKNVWWCALGCWTAYQGGIPGFENVVKTGYMDLYVRADRGGVPSEYVELEYIESTGASYFNTGEKFNCESDECKVIFKGNDTANNGMIFASSGGKYFWFYYYSNQGIRVYADNGNGQQGIAGIASDLNKHTMEWKGKHYYIDGVDKGTMSNTYTETTNNIWLFSCGGSSYPFKGRIYYADIKRGGIYTRIFKPVKRRSDSVAGMYDVVTNTFFPSSATAFTAGPEI